MNAPLLTREEILSFDYMKKLLQDTDQKEIISLVAQLKEQCKELKVDKSDFTKLIKLVESDIRKGNKVVTKNVDMNYVPEEITIIPEIYQVDANGINVDLNGYINEVCPHPIFPVEILKDIDTGEEQIKIKYYKRNTWEELVVDRVDLATKKGITKMAKVGIAANDNTASFLIKWFSDIESYNQNYIKTILCTNTLGYTSKGFIPYTSDVVYSGKNIDNKRRFELYKEHGDKETWIKWQIKCFDYTIPKIVIAGAYASLLLEKFGINPFGIHLWGTTGKGKSVSILTSASVYGYPDIKNGIVYTGNATNNGLEARLAFVKNCAFYLDELSMLSDNQIEDMIYMIMQGQGKARMSKDGFSRSTYYWNCVSISNSEMPITNDTQKGGIYNRIVQICPDTSIFGDMNLQELCEIFKNNYGFGAKMFIELLDNPEIEKEIKELKKKYYADIVTNTEDKQANAGSCILTAFEIARKYIYKTDKVLTADELKQYLFTIDDISQVHRTYKKLCEWIQGNQKMFDASDIGMKQKWGSYRADDYVVILPFYFSDFCKRANINEKQFLKGLKQKKLLLTDKESNKKTIREGGKLTRVIYLKLPLVYEDKPEDSYHILDMNGNEINDKDLPF